MSIRDGIVCTGIEKVVVYGVNFAQGVILARLLGPEDFGLTAMLGIFLGIGAILADGGLGTALVVFGAGGHDQRVFRWNVGIASALCAVFALAAPWIADWYAKPILSPLMRVMAVGLVVNAAAVVAVARLTRAERFGRLAVANVACVLAGAATAVALAQLGFGVWSIVWTGLVAGVVKTAAVWLLQPCKDGGDPADAAPGDPPVTFRALLGYGMKLTVSGVVHTVYTESYNLVIGKLWSPAAVGLFVRGQRWAELPGQVANEAVGRVALPALAKANRPAATFVGLNALLLWPGLVVLGVWAPEIVRFVLGPKWLDCVPYLRILLTGQFFWAFSNILLQRIRASGHSDLFLMTDVWKKPLGFLALACGVPFGVAGLCWAKVASDIVECAVDAVYAVRCVRREASC